MADPATQFQTAGLNVPYQFTPTHYVPGSVLKLDPVNYGAIQGALQGLQEAFTKGPLNPAVRAEMQEESARYNLGRDVITDLDKLSPDERMRRVGINQGGPQIPPGYQVGVSPPTNVPPPPPAPAPAPTTDNPPQTNNPPNVAPGVTVPGEQTPSNAGRIGQPDFNSAANASGVNQAAAVGAQGVNIGATALSPFAPAKQNVAPAPNANPVRDTTPQGNQPIVQNQAQQAQSPGAANLADQQALVQWQNNQAHPVAAAGDVLKYVKQNYTTQAQDVTYLPTGGPNGTPAYAIHMKGGATNVVPLSQLVKNGMGPTVASQNTSHVLNAAEQGGMQGADQGQQPQGQQIGAAQPQLAQQGPQPGIQPQGQQLAQNVPGAPGTPQITANTPLSPEEKAYIASQTGDVSVLAADTNNHQLLQANAQKNQATGNTALAPNTIRDNPSNVPRSLDPTHESPLPNNAVVGQADAAANAELARVEASPGGRNSLPQVNDADTGNLGDVRKLGGPTKDGYQWFVEANPDPNSPDSHWPFFIVNTSPWAQTRMINLPGNKWESFEVVRPDRVLDKMILDKTFQDSTSWRLPNGQPDQARKINTLRAQYLLENSKPMNDYPALVAKLNSLRQDALESQRLVDATKVGPTGKAPMSPDDWGWLAQRQNDAANSANALGGAKYIRGASWADQFYKAAVKAFAPGGVDQKLKLFTTSYANLMGGYDNNSYTPGERNELDAIKDLGMSFPGAIERFNHSRMQEYNRYANQALTDRIRLSDDFFGTAQEITDKHRIHDGDIPRWNSVPGRADLAPTPTPGPSIPKITPTPTPSATPSPTPIPVPANNSQAHPIDMDSFGYTREQKIEAARRLPSGTMIHSGGKTFPVP